MQYNGIILKAFQNSSRVIITALWMNFYRNLTDNMIAFVNENLPE